MSTTSENYREVTKNRIGFERHNVNSQLPYTPRCAIRRAITVVARVAHRLLLSWWDNLSAITSLT